MLFKAAAMALTAVLAALVSYHPGVRSALFPRQLPTWARGQVNGPVLAPEEVREHDGVGGNKAYLVILGEVYDVTGSESYAPGSGYHVFIGKDATAAFSTGDFAPGAGVDDVSALSPSQLRSIETWVDFYRKHEKYRFVGVLRGRYYDAAGRRGKHWEAARAQMERGARAEKEREALGKRYPSCNSKWTQTTGSEVWCTPAMLPEAKAPLVPRVLVQDDAQRCACMDSALPAPAELELHEYPGCAPDASKCAMAAVPDFRKPKQARQPPPGSVLNRSN